MILFFKTIYNTKCKSASVVWLFIVLFFHVTVIHAQNVDIHLLRHINLNRNTTFDPAFTLITHSVTPIGIAVPITEATIGLITHKKDLKIKAVTAVSSVVIAYGVTAALKYSINRPRPYITYPYIENGLVENDPSFPSGHASSAFATATSLTLAFKKWYVIAPAYSWAGAAAYSRLHLGVHYPSDVLAGALVGSGSAWLCFEMQKRILKKSKLKKPDLN